MKKLLCAVLAGAFLTMSQIPAQPAQAAPTIDKTHKIELGGLYELVFDPADNRLYVTATGGRGSEVAKLIVLDADTLEQVGEIDVTESPVYGLGINTKTKTLYGTNTRKGIVAAIDIATGKMTKIQLEGRDRAHVRDVVVDEEANKIYISVVGGRSRDPKVVPPPSQVWVIDGATNKLERAIDIDKQVLTGIAVDTAGKRVFGTGLKSNEVFAVDLASGKVLGTWPSGGEAPVNIEYDAKHNRLFVANQGSGNVVVLDAQSGEQKGDIASGEGALDVIYNPLNDRLYVTNRKGGTTSVIDGTSFEIVANLETGTLPQTAVLDSKTGRVFVTNKARGRPRNAPADTPVPVDPNGDTVVIINP